MKWSITPGSYEVRLRALELALERHVPQGRLCLAATCLARSQVAVLVEIDGRRGWVGACQAHLSMFVREHAAVVRGPTRRLLMDEVMNNAPVTPETEEPPGDAADESVMRVYTAAVPSWGRRRRR